MHIEQGTFGMGVVGWCIGPDGKPADWQAVLQPNLKAYMVAPCPCQQFLRSMERYSTLCTGALAAQLHVADHFKQSCIAAGIDATANAMPAAGFAFGWAQQWLSHAVTPCCYTSGLSLCARFEQAEPP
jgi:hypothetical protein